MSSPVVLARTGAASPEGRGPVASLWVTMCRTCGIEPMPCDCPAAGRLLASLHDDLHHKGVPTMEVRGSWPCDGCGGPANRVLPSPGGYAVICSQCASPASQAGSTGRE